jgi:hypothetical protein
MLKRNVLMDKKKKKKAEIEKVYNMAKQKVEIDLKNQNKKSEKDFLSLEEIQPDKLKYVVPEDFLRLLIGLKKV